MARLHSDEQVSTNLRPKCERECFYRKDHICFDSLSSFSLRLLLINVHQAPTTTRIFLSSLGCLLLGSDERKEHVESNLDSVDEDETVLGRDELEVNGVHNRPDLPGSLACVEEVVLELV